LTQEQCRIFFALWPPAAVRASLAATAAQLPLARPARLVPDYNLHLTLHFIGNVGRADADCMRQRARAVGGEAFELAIDRYGYFGGARVGWLGCTGTPDALFDLHQRLGQELRDCGYRPEAHAYRPHVTVARKLDRLPDAPPFEPLPWKVDNFVLVESRAAGNGARYEVVETYPLQ
jgi:2'-5' RNA ligase